MHARGALFLQLLRRLFHQDPEVLHLVLRVDLRHLGEELLLLFLDVVLDVLLEHLDLRVELRIVRLHLEQVGDDALHREVLFHRFLQELLGASVLRRRIEVLLLDRRMHRQRVGHFVEKLLLLARLRFLDLLEELLDLFVLLFQQLDRVHGASSRS